VMPNQHVDAGCVGGICSLTCEAGYKHCSNNPTGVCGTYIASDVNNCGDCGFACPAIAHGTSTGCQNGQCTFTCDQAPWADCDGQLLDGCETDLSSDPNHCGSCQTVCPPDPNGTPTCSGGGCSFNCNSGYNLCGGSCISNTDMNNCGGCGSVCGPPNSTVAATTCATGTCEIATCYGTRADCNGTFSDGCEKNLANDFANCGACGHACPYDPLNPYSCIGGKCCYQDCDTTAVPPVCMTVCD